MIMAMTYVAIGLMVVGACGVVWGFWLMWTGREVAKKEHRRSGDLYDV